MNLRSMRSPPLTASPALIRSVLNRFRRLRLSTRVGLLTCLVVASTARSADSATGSITPPRAIHQVAPVFPKGVNPLALPGKAEITCLVDETGAVIQARVRSASQPEFGEAALTAALLWKFQPALKDGRPVSRNVAIPFVFHGDRGTQVEQAIGRVVFVDLPYTPIPAESLERMPEPKRRAWPRYPEDLRGTGAKGSVTLAFVIGHDGFPVNPEVVSATRPDFEVPSLLAVLSLQFPPVLDAEGNPQLVSMLIRFDFNESMLKEQDKESQRRIFAPRPNAPAGSPMAPARRLPRNVSP